MTGKKKFKNHKKLPASVQDVMESIDVPQWELSPEEFAHLKKIHGNDPFPLTDTIEEESAQWVSILCVLVLLLLLLLLYTHTTITTTTRYLEMQQVWASNF